MLTGEEMKLKKLYIKKKKIENKIVECEGQLVLSETLIVWKHPIDFQEILDILKSFLNRNNYTWFDITLHSLNPANDFAFFPNRNSRFRIYLFGKKMFILRNIEEIVQRIVHGHTIEMEEAVVSWKKIPGVEDFI